MVSVIIPTYNRAAFLEKAIDSVLAQTYQDFELIIVDDGSTDNTADLVSSFDRRIVYIFQDNRGVAAARNSGIRAASYDLIAFLDSDDCFTAKKLELQLDAMQKKSEYLVSHTQEIWFRNGCHLNQKKRHRKEGGFIFSRCLELCAVGMSTIMARRQLFELVGLFNEDLPCCEDYDLWLRVSARYPFLLVDHPLTIKDGGRPDQLSVKYRVGMDRFRIEAIKALLDSNSLDERQLQLAQKELVRKCRIYANGCLKHGRSQEGKIYSGLARQYE